MYHNKKCNTRNIKGEQRLALRDIPPGDTKDELVSISERYGYSLDERAMFL